MTDNPALGGERDALKRDILIYLRDFTDVTDRDTIKKALGSIKAAAYETASVNAEVRRNFKNYLSKRTCRGKLAIADDEEFYYRISWHFAPRHYRAIAAFVKRFELVLEAEQQAEAELESAINEKIDQQSSDPLADEYYAELGAPDFAIVVYSHHIEVRAYESGVGEALPPGRKYIGCQGDIRWRYPVSALDSLKRLGRPIVDIEELRSQP